MKLIFLYGPPAAGKLTVAKELAELTKFKIFHNHHTVDLLNKFFKFGTKTFFNLNSKFRLDIFEAAAKEKIRGLIFTFCYAYGDADDNTFVKNIIKKVKKYNGNVYFVHIYCNKNELFKRVKHASRGDFNKVKTVKDLKKVLRKFNFFKSIPFVKSLKIDTTKLSPKKAALMIKKCYNL